MKSFNRQVVGKPMKQAKEKKKKKRKFSIFDH